MPWSMPSAGGVVLRVHGPRNPTRPVAVVLHGVGSTADFALRCLAGPLDDAGYDVVAPDLRGHGGSTALLDPADHAIEGHLTDLEALSSLLPVALLAGISLGAQIALTSLARGTAPAGGALLCLPGVTGPDSGPAAANREFADELARRGVDALLESMTTADGALPWVVDEVRESWRRHDAASLVAALRAVAEYDVVPQKALRAVSTPVGVVAVGDDAAHPAEVAAGLVRALPRAALRTLRLADLADDRTVLGWAALAALDEAASASR